MAVDIVGEIDEGDDMDGELAEDGADDVRVEDVRLGALFGETFNGLWEVLAAARWVQEVKLPLLVRWRGSRRS